MNIMIKFIYYPAAVIGLGNGLRLFIAKLLPLYLVFTDKNLEHVGHRSVFLALAVPIHDGYRRISNIRRTEPPNVDVSRLVLQLSLPNPIKPGVKSRMKM